MSTPIALPAPVLELLRSEHAGDAGIVYCLSRRSVEQTAELLFHFLENLLMLRALGKVIAFGRVCV